MLWNPGSKYEIYLPALEKTFVSRKLPYPRAAIAHAGGQTRDTVTTISDSLARGMRGAAPLTDSLVRPVNAGAVPSDSGALVKP